jgi:adenosylmethionine-8-amino-7-oxononanoate aminotransferase
MAERDAGLDLPARDARVVWHPYTQHGLAPEPLAVTGAQGAWLQLADGTRRLDAISSWWSCLHGHAHPRIVAAIAAQAAALDHVLLAGCTHEPAVALAEELLALAPRRAGTTPLTRVFYTDDGSTAIEAALKMAIGAWVRRGEPARTTIIALEGAYHGDTFGAMAAGDPVPFFREFGPFLFHVVRVPPDPEAIGAAMRAQSGRVAAVIVEPLVQGAAGMRMHSAEFLREARRLCDASGALMIADEVMTFCRTGRVTACERAGIVPDLLCLAKGLTGGTLPLAATLATEAIFDAFRSSERGRAFFHGHTYTGNPIACAAARASLALLRERDVPTRLDALGRRIAETLDPLRDDPRVRDLRRCGGIVALELHAPDAGYLAGLGERLRAACRAQPEVLLRPLGNVLYALPPACVTDEEADLLAAAIGEVVCSA